MPKWFIKMLWYNLRQIIKPFIYIRGSRNYLAILWEEKSWACDTKRGSLTASWHGMNRCQHTNQYMLLKITRCEEAWLSISFGTICDCEDYFYTYLHLLNVTTDCFPLQMWMNATMEATLPAARSVPTRWANLNVCVIPVIAWTEMGSHVLVSVHLPCKFQLMIFFYSFFFLLLYYSQCHAASQRAIISCFC